MIKKKSIIAAVAMSMCMTAAAGGALLAETSYAASSETELKSEYILGTDECKDIKIPKKDNATAYITAPSGITYRAGDAFTPTEEGLYKVTYKTETADGIEEESKTFLVCKQKYSVGSARSSVDYGYRSYGDYVVDKNKRAVLTSVGSADKFTYAEIIDLNELDGEAFFKFFVTPENIGTPDAQKIDVVLTDVNDPENFVTISIKKGTSRNPGDAWAERNSYITGNAASQVPTGLETGKNNDIEIGGISYQIHKSDDWGANIPFALPGNPKYESIDKPNNDPKYIGDEKLALSFDVETNSIYANDKLVTALSNEDLYGVDVWEGFSDGRCFLTVSATNYNASALNLGVLKLGKHDTADNEAFETKNNKFKDEIAPRIVICDEEKLTPVPNAVVGKSYRLFAANAVDDYSRNLTVNREVYYNYRSANEVTVDCAAGEFVPFAAGEYTIVYTAADAYGNVGKKEIIVTAEGETAKPMTVEVEDIPAALAGVDCPIPEPQISGNRGAASWRAVAKNEEAGAEYEISSENPVFFPEYAGDYAVEYYVNDYVSEVVVTKSLKVEKNDEPVFFGQPVLPKYLLYGCIYNFPKIDAKIYSSGAPVAVVPEIYVSEDGGEEKKASYRYVSYAKETIRIIYRVDNGGAIKEYTSAEIPVIDGGYGGVYNIAGYFDGDGLKPVSQGKFMRFVPDEDIAAGDSVRTTFINALQTFDFNVRFAASGLGFDTVNLYLTDASDEDVQIKLTYKLHADGDVYFAINDGAEILLDGTYFNDGGKPLSPDITDNGTCVMPTGTTAFRLGIANDLKGREFTGFTGSMAYLTLEIEGIKQVKQTGLDIFSISGQPISGIYVDNIEPRISAKADSGARPCGTKYVIRPVYVADVLDPSVICKMSVKAPDGSYAVATDGTVLNEYNCRTGQTYELILDQYGSYEVRYVATDMGGNVLDYGYMLTSADMTAPEVEIVAPVTEGKVNGSVAVAEIIIRDNRYTSPEDFTVFRSVETPQGQTFGLFDKDGKEHSSFIAKSQGVYTVHYLVIDKGGNTTHASYTVTIS